MKNTRSVRVATGAVANVRAALAGPDIDWNVIREEDLKSMPEALAAVRCARDRYKELEWKVRGLLCCIEEAGGGARVWDHLAAAEKAALAGEKTND